MYWFRLWFDKFIPKGPINNIPALGQIMAWCRPGTINVRLPTHICFTRPQWVKVIFVSVLLITKCYLFLRSSLPTVQEKLLNLITHSLTHFTRPRGQISGSRVGHQRYRALLMVPTVGPHCCIVLKCWTLVIIQCDTNFVANGVFSAGEGDVYPPDWHWKWGVGIHRGSGWQVVTKRGRIPGKWNMADEHSCSWSFNSLSPGGRSGNNFEIIILELIYWIDILINSY